MKKIVIGIIIGMFLFGAAFAGVTNEIPEAEDMNNSERTQLSKVYEFTTPKITENDNYVTVSIDNTRSLMQEGKPVLPYLTDTIMFPIGTKITVHVEAESAKTFQLDKKVEPYPMYTLLTTQNKYVIDEEKKIYEANELFPREIVDDRITIGIYNNERVTTLSLFLYPCQYHPIENTLDVTDTITLKIDYELPETPLTFADSYEFVIIAPDDWTAELETLKQHKENHGLSTAVVGLNEIYSGTHFAVQGIDDAEKVKYFIKDAIEQWGTTYVMLVGGRQGGILKANWLVPIRYSHLDDQSNWDFGYLSDLYFADIYKYDDGQPVFDDWDSDDNGVFAEWSGFRKDILDMNPDVYLGRLACRSDNDLTNMINKIITYENTYSKEQDWFNKFIVVAGDTFTGYGESVAEGELGTSQSVGYMDDFEAVKLYASLNTLTGIPDVVNTINQGAGFLNFEGHGNPMNWATHPPNDPETWIDGLGVRDMTQLTNEEQWPICVVGGCHNSQFNVSLVNWIKIWEGAEHWYQYLWRGEATYKCWSWRLTSTISNGGAIATIGSTGLGYGYIGEDAISGLGGWIDSEFFRVYGQEDIEILGQVHTTAIANYISQFPVQTDNIDAKTVQEWALLGDPTLMIGGYQ